MYLYIFFVILVIAIVVLFTYFSGQTNKESFDNSSNSKVTTNNAYIKQGKTFMVRDVNNRFWLNTDGNGIARFRSSGFGFNFMLSNNPDQSLPLRSANNPNDYLIATTNGNKEFRIVSNPGSNLLKIQVMNFGGKNILGYTDNNSKDVFINIDQAGYIHSVGNASDASVVSLIFT